MPSFDVVSQVDKHELLNAVDQTNREVSNRFDFKDSGARVVLEGSVLTLYAPSEFQLTQMVDILHAKLSKRGVDLGCLEAGKPEITGKEVRQSITVRQGIDSELARNIMKRVKDSKLKVQASAQGEQVRVSGKKRDDLQQVIALLRQADLSLPLQFINFRD